MEIFILKILNHNVEDGEYNIALFILKKGDIKFCSLSYGIYFIKKLKGKFCYRDTKLFFIRVM
jgi:hypothetical protein